MGPAATGRTLGAEAASVTLGRTQVLALGRFLAAWQELAVHVGDALRKDTGHLRYHIRGRRSSSSCTRTVTWIQGMSGIAKDHGTHARR